MCVKDLYVWWDGHPDSSTNITRYVEKSIKKNNIPNHLNCDYTICSCAVFLLFYYVFLKKSYDQELQYKEYETSLQNDEVLSCFSFLTFSITLR